MWNEAQACYSRATSQGQENRWNGALTPALVEDEIGLARLRAEWDRLHAATGGTNVFTEWTWVWRWWEVFGRTRGLTHHRLRMLVLRDREGVVRAIIPTVLTSYGTGPLAARCLRFYGFVQDANLTELAEPLVWPGWESDTAAELIRSLRGKQRLYNQYHWCDLQYIPADNALGQCLASWQSTDWNWSAGPINYVLPLPSTWDELGARLKRNIRESLRHCYNSLAREGHQWSFEVVTEPGLLTPALDEFFRWHGTRASLDRGPSHPDHFRGPKSRAFLRLVAQDLAPTGRFMVCRLWVNGAVVASRAVFRVGDGLYLYYSGFDPAWSRYSVMTTLTAECIRMAIAAGLHRVYLSSGTDVSKTRWGPEEQPFGRLRSVAPTSQARALIEIHRQAQGRRRALARLMRRRSRNR